MPSTENTTLDRIQREIMDVMEREKELRTSHTKNDSNNNNKSNEVKVNGNAKLNGADKSPLLRAQSTSVLTNGDAQKAANFRRFASNPNSKGVMHRFFKSRGKINVVTTLSNGTSKNQWTPAEFSSPKLSIEPGKRIRNGFVPVEERLKKEIQDAHNREIELRTQRRKSQPDFGAILDLDMPLEEPRFGLRATKSMAQLYDSCENLEETVSAPSSLKPARSLAELCDATEDEIQTPQSLIMRFEKMITKNKETARI